MIIKKNNLTNRHRQSTLVTKVQRVISICILAVILFPVSIIPDTLYLKNGRQLQGKVIGQTMTTIQFRTEGRVDSILKTSIQRIVYSTEEEEKRIADEQRQKEEIRLLELRRQEVLRRDSESKRRSDFGAIQSAIQDYTKAITLEPKRADAYVNRGIAKAILQDYQGAIQDFTQAIALDPGIAAITYCERGAVKEDLRDYRGAIQDYTQATVLDPILADAFVRRGAARIKAGAKKEGCSDLNRAGDLGKSVAFEMISQYCR